MERQVQTAFCKLIFAEHGGRYTEAGLPIFREEGTVGLCDVPFDCGGCRRLQDWCAHLAEQGWDISWECDACLRETEKAEKEAGIRRHLQGYYQEGGKHPWASPDEPEPPLSGCTRCGWHSILLQLVLRRNA